MRKLGIVIAVAVLAGVAMGGKSERPTDQSLRDTAVQRALTDAAAKLVASPKIPKGMRVAVVPLGKDKDGSVTGKLANKLAGATSLDIIVDSGTLKGVVFPEVIDKMKLEDVMNEDTKAKLQVLHVAGLIYGQVDELVTSRKGARAALSLSLVEVSSGRLLWGASVAGQVDVKTPPPPPKDDRKLGGVLMFAAALLGVAIIVWFASRRRRLKGTPESPDNKLDRDSALCDRMGRELRDAKALLKDAQDAAYGAEKGDLVTAIKDAVDKVSRLADDIQLAPAGSAGIFKGDGVKAEDLDKLVAHDSVLEQLLGEITSMAQKAKSNAADDEAVCQTNLLQIGNLADQLRRKVEERRDFLVG